MRRQRGSEENGQTPRKQAYDRSNDPANPFRWRGFSRMATFMFSACLLLATLLGIISSIPDMVTGHFTVDALGNLALSVLGFAVVGTTVITAPYAIIGLLELA